MMPQQLHERIGENLCEVVDVSPYMSLTQLPDDRGCFIIVRQLLPKWANARPTAGPLSDCKVLGGSSFSVPIVWILDDGQRHLTHFTVAMSMLAHQIENCDPPEFALYISEGLGRFSICFSAKFSRNEILRMPPRNVHLILIFGFLILISA